MRDFGAPGLKWDVFVKPLLSRVRDPCRREGRKVVGARGGGYLQRKHLLDPTGPVHRGTHRDLIAHRVQTGQIQTWREGSGRRVPSLTKKLLVIDTGWEREDLFSSVECPWVYQGKAPFPGIVGQHKIDSI